MCREVDQALKDPQEGPQRLRTMGMAAPSSGRVWMLTGQKVSRFVLWGLQPGTAPLQGPLHPQGQLLSQTEFLRC